MGYVTPTFEMTRALAAADGRTVMVWFGAPATIGSGGSGGFGVYLGETLVSDLSYLAGDTGIVFIFRADIWFEPVTGLSLRYTQPGNGVESLSDADLPTSVIGMDSEYVAPTSPSILSKVVDETGHTLTIIFDRPMSKGTDYSDASFSLNGSISGEGVPIAYVSGSGTATFVFSIVKTIRESEAVGLNYTGGVGRVVDALGQSLGAFSNSYVTNYSEATASDLILWHGFGGTITDGVYAGTVNDYPPYGTAPVVGLVYPISTVVKVGSSSLRRETVSGQPMPSIKFGLPPNGPFRVGVWHRRDSGPNHTALAIRSSTDAAQGIRVVVTSQTSLRLSGQAGNTGWSILEDVAWSFPNEAWIFFELSLDMATKTIKVYVDGVLVLTYVDTRAVPTNAYDVLLLEETSTVGLIDYHDNLMVSDRIDRDLYTLSLLDGYPE